MGEIRKFFLCLFGVVTLWGLVYYLINKAKVDQGVAVASSGVLIVLKWVGITFLCVVALLIIAAVQYIWFRWRHHKRRVEAMTTKLEGEARQATETANAIQGEAKQKNAIGDREYGLTPYLLRTQATITVREEGFTPYLIGREHALTETAWQGVWSARLDNERKHLELPYVTRAENEWVQDLREPMGTRPILANYRSAKEPPPQLVPAEAHFMPPKLDLYTILAQEGFVPNESGIFLARGSITNSIIVPPRKICHLIGGGPTGGGKSILMRDIIAQLVTPRVDADVYLYNPMFAQIKIDPVSNALIDWRPILPRLKHPVYTDSHTFTQFLDWVLCSALEERKQRERRLQPIGKATFIGVEEMPILADESPEAIEHLARLLKRARQYAIFVICIAQNLLVKQTGLDSGDRTNLRTGVYTGGADDTTVKVVLDVPTAKSIDESLLVEAGASYCRADGIQVQPARIPYASNKAIYHLLGAPSVPLPDYPLSAAELEHYSALLADELAGAHEPLISHTEEVRDDFHENGSTMVRTDVEPGENPVRTSQVLTEDVRIDNETYALIRGAAEKQMRETGQFFINKSMLVKALRANTHDPYWNNNRYREISFVLDREQIPHERK